MRKREKSSVLACFITRKEAATAMQSRRERRKHKCSPLLFCLEPN